MKGFVGFFLLGCSALLLLISLMVWFLWRRNRRRVQAVQAKVVENVRRRDARGRPLYFPVLEFQWEGENKRLESAFGWGWEQFQPSERVSAFYDPRHDRMAVKPPVGPGVLALCLFVISLLCLVGGSMMLASML